MGTNVTFHLGIVWVFKVGVSCIGVGTSEGGGGVGMLLSFFQEKFQPSQ